MTIAERRRERIAAVFEEANREVRQMNPLFELAKPEAAFQMIQTYLFAAILDTLRNETIDVAQIEF